MQKQTNKQKTHQVSDLSFFLCIIEVTIFASSLQNTHVLIYKRARRLYIHS